MQRDFYDTLIEWKNNNITTPLLVVGARQVGKTYIIDKFCRENFSDYVYVSLKDNTRVVNIFKKDINTEDKAREFFLELRCNVTEDTVIFVDEAQESEELISAMKYFNEAEFPYKFILAGSLLGVKLNRFTSSFPVGKVEFAYMYPMSFKEFLTAIGKSSFIPLIEECYKENKAMSNEFHEELLSDYRNYLCTGGFPKNVAEFVSNKNILQRNGSSILRGIVDAYTIDMNRYTTSIHEKNKIENVYNNIAPQLAKENKKYQISKIDKHARYRDYESAIDWLLSSRLVIPCYYVNRFETALKGFMDETNFKMYVNDVGLLVELLSIPYSNILLDQDFLYKGSIAENYVAQQLTCNNINLYYYYESQVMEIDFLIDVNDGIIPIEVKSSDHKESKSLMKYINEYKPNYAIRISTRNFGFDNNIKSVPLYAVFCIKR